MAPAGTDTLEGLTAIDTAPEAEVVTVTVAVADFERSAALVATTVNVPVVAGAV
jgi:hypothetical protein